MTPGARYSELQDQVEAGKASPNHPMFSDEYWWDQGYLTGQFEADTGLSEDEAKERLEVPAEWAETFDQGFSDGYNDSREN